MTESRKKPMENEDNTAITPHGRSTLLISKNLVFTFLGPNDIGRTEAIKLVLSFTRPTSCGGTILAHELTMENKIILV